VKEGDRAADLLVCKVAENKQENSHQVMQEHLRKVHASEVVLAKKQELGKVVAQWEKVVELILLWKFDVRPIFVLVVKRAGASKGRWEDQRVFEDVVPENSNTQIVSEFIKFHGRF